MNMPRWIYRLFHNDAVDQQLDSELQFHLEQQIADNVAAGMTSQDARRKAQIALGGVEQVKQKTRDVHWENFLENIWRDLRFAIRGWNKDRRFALTAVFALALGIGASTVVFSVFYNLTFDAFTAKDASRLVVPAVQDAADPGKFTSLDMSLADLDVVRDQNQVFEGIVGYVVAGGIVLASDGAQMHQFYASSVTADAFQFYGVAPLLGRAIIPNDGIPGAAPIFVMSYDTWKGVFNGDVAILDRIFTIDGTPRTLVGIMPPRFHAYGTQEEIWVPITRTSGAPKRAGEYPANLLARLKPGVTLESASANFNLIVQHLAILHPDDFPKHLVASVQPAAAFTAGSQMQRELYSSLAAATLLLLIACMNVANLLLARATVREKDIAIRSALGATRGRIVRQLLVESVVLATMACAVGCVAAWLGLKVLTTNIPGTGLLGFSSIGGLGEADLSLNPPVLLFAVAISFLTVVICGLAPGLHVVRAKLQPKLAGADKGTGGGFRHGRLRSALVIGEVALSIVLLIGTGLIMRSFSLLAHVDLGFNPRNLLLVLFVPPPSQNKTPPVQTFHTPEGQALLRRVEARLKILPGVAEVALTDTIPGRGPVRGPQVTVPGTTYYEEAGLLGCDENFSRTVELQLLRGRWLSVDEVQTAQYVAVISQRLAHDLFGDRNPLGERLEVKAFTGPAQTPKDTFFQIVGVVRDMKSAGPSQPPIPIVFLPFTVRGGFAFVLKTTVEPASLQHVVQEQIWAEDRNEVIALSSPVTDLLKENIHRSLEFGLLISTPMSGIALLLVIVGIFGVMAYNVALQTHDIGIRLALGAQREDILRMVLGKGLVLIAVGVLIGVGMSVGLTRSIASQLWGVSPTDPWTFTAVVFCILIVGLAACFFPARRATQVDPIVTLRYE